MIIEIGNRTFCIEHFEITETQKYTKYEKVPDPYWRYTDDHGHRHHWAGQKLPTLVLSSYRDEDGYRHYVCTRCGDVVKPGYTERPTPDAEVDYYQYRIKAVYDGWRSLSALNDIIGDEVTVSHNGDEGRGYFESFGYDSDKNTTKIEVYMISKRRLFV